MRKAVVFVLLLVFNICKLFCQIEFDTNYYKINKIEELKGCYILYSQNIKTQKNLRIISIKSKSFRKNEKIEIGGIYSIILKFDTTSINQPIIIIKHDRIWTPYKDSLSNYPYLAINLRGLYYIPIEKMENKKRYKYKTLNDVEFLKNLTSF